MRNLLLSFDDFKENELLSDRDLQDYLGKYQDLRDEWNRRRESGESTDITDDIVFEIELIKQIEINIDYILILVKKYHDSQCKDEEVLVSIKRQWRPAQNSAAKSNSLKHSLPKSMKWRMLSVLAMDMLPSNEKKT